MGRMMGYPLPDLESIETTVCVNLILPDNPELLRAFWGQVFALSNHWNWGLEITEDTRDAAREVGEYWRQIYADNRDSNIEYVCPEADEEDEDDAPYWDDAESMAGAGEGTKWGYEEIADWGVTAFLAVAGSPAAALFYRTTVPRARLAFQSMDLGDIVNIFIDGILAGSVNTASAVPGVAEIIEVPIDLVQFAADNSLTGVERLIRLVAA